MRARLIALALAVLVASASVFAASYTKFEQITVAAVSIGFTLANINNLTGVHPSAVQAVCRLELAEVRYTIDGTTPTTTVGTPWEPLETLTFNGSDTLNNFRAIRTGGTSGQLDCTYVGAF